MRIYILLFLTMYRAISLPILNIKVGIIPFVIGSYYFFKMKNKSKIYKLLGFQLSLFMIYFLSVIISQAENMSGVKIFIIDFIFLFQAIGVVMLSEKESLNYIVKKFINIILFQCIMGIVFWIYPTIGININKYFMINSHILNQIEQIEGRRLYGIGTLYFGAGVYNIIAVLFSMYIYHRENKKKYLVKALFIIIIGNFYSRATLIAIPIIVIGVLYKISLKKIIELLWNKYIILIVFITGISLNKLISTDKAKTLLKWGFEIINILINNKKNSSESLDILISFFSIVPDSLKTIFIGDGLWEVGSYYYKNIDVGYLRLIYLYGLIGLGLNIIFLLYIISKNCNKLTVSLFLIYLILNIKGYVNINFLFYIIYLKNIENKKFLCRIKN